MNNLQNIFRRNLPVKILALVAAIILWGYVMNEENPSVTASFTIPVETGNGPEGFNVSLDEKEVKIKVRAARSLMAAVHEGEFKATVDLSGFIEGENSAKVKVTVPQGFELVESSENTILVTLESLIARGVPVDIHTWGNPAEGITVAKVVPQQEYVNVYGPRHLVESIAKAAGQVQLSGNSTDFTIKVKLSAIDKNGNRIPDLAVLPGDLDVTIQLAQGLTKKILAVHPKYEGTLPDGYILDSVSVEPAQLEVTADEKILANWKEIETSSIDLSTVDGPVTREVDLIIPDGATVPNRKATVKVRAVPK